MQQGHILYMLEVSFMQEMLSYSKELCLILRIFLSKLLTVVWTVGYSVLCILCVCVCVCVYVCECVHYAFSPSRQQLLGIQSHSGLCCCCWAPRCQAGWGMVAGGQSLAHFHNDIPSQLQSKKNKISITISFRIEHHVFADLPDSNIYLLVS